MKLEQFAAQEIVEALRSGVVPRAYVSYFTVGRERYAKALLADCPFIGHGGYKVRIVVGDKGYGKTHLLSMLAGDALEQGFAFSHVELHSREAPLERMEVIVASLIRNCLLGAARLTLEQYLAKWVGSFGLTTRSEIEGWLRLASPSLEFRAMLRYLLAQPSHGDSGLWDPIADVALWLTGGTPSAGLSKATGVRAAISSRNAGDLLTSFATFANRSGCAGLFIALDEAEAITSLTTAARRDEANRTLRRLLDNPEKRTHIEVVFATTRRFVDDEHRGARSYPALWERIRQAVSSDAFNPRATMLELAPLTMPELVELGLLLSEIHGIAHEWKPRIDADGLSQLGGALFGDRPRIPRPFVRALVTVLDVLQQDQAVRLDGLLSGVAVSWASDE